MMKSFATALTLLLTRSVRSTVVITLRVMGVWLVAGGLLPCAAQQPLSSRFYKDIDTDPLKQEEIIAPILDSAVYAAALDGFVDLRVLDRQGNEVPYLLEKVTETRAVSVRRTAPAKEVSLRELAE